MRLAEDFLNDVLDQVALDLRVRDVGGVLRGDDDIDDLDRLAVDVADGNL